MATWVFQGNPDRFDVDDYLAWYPELIYWRTPRHANAIAVGDRAFIWRSGPQSGAVALGTIAEAPKPASKVQHPEALGDDLWRSEQPDPEEVKTGIRLHDIRLSADDGYVPRSAARDDPELSKATIITMPNGTVFPLDDAQSLALERLWAGTASEGVDAGGSAGAPEGARRLQSHYRRERSSALRDQKLAEVHATYGKYACALCGQDDTEKYPAELARRVFEVHHLAPLSKAATPVRTTLSDLSVLCANCHRAVHATPAVEQNYAELAHRLRSPC